MKLFVASVLLLLTLNKWSFAWSERGHHIIAVLAYHHLARPQQAEILRLIKAHPRFQNDFEMPSGTKYDEHWLVGRAACWPDIAHKLPKWNRPTWHNEPGASVTIGQVKPLSAPGPLPVDATLETQELYTCQAFQLCHNILHDEEQADADRAVALCWVMHLAADLHQPCNAGSLYAEGIYADGDRNAKAIKTSQAGNLHALWDGLLGREYDTDDVAKWITHPPQEYSWLGFERDGSDLTQRFGGRKNGWDNANTLDTAEWVVEGRRLASVVYPPGLQREIEGHGKAATALPETNANSIVAAPEYGRFFVEPPSYLQLARKVAVVRACMAGFRLRKLLAAMPGIEGGQNLGLWRVTRMTLPQNQTMLPTDLFSDKRTDAFLIEAKHVTGMRLTQWTQFRVNFSLAIRDTAKTEYSYYLLPVRAKDQPNLNGSARLKISPKSPNCIELRLEVLGDASDRKYVRVYTLEKQPRGREEAVRSQAKLLRSEK
ncbi:MAG TPA: hypothetical protein DDW52_06390 [Planctomycetaceae bacterium]|nr:hypothetical protein [Planctomycetaceae bacterium]